MSSTRLDKYLFENGFCDSRSKAREMLDAGVVSINGEVVTKPSRKVIDTDQVAAKPLPQHNYVSRAGYKLEKALDCIGLSVDGLMVLDIGQSTGGFSDCLIQRGAKTVVGIDVGTDQLHACLKDHEQIKNHENVNAKDLACFLESHSLVKSFDFIVMDLSFISMTKVVGQFSKALAPSGKILSLIKPQFELGPQALDSYGVVRDKSLYSGLEVKIKEVMRQEGFRVLEYLESELVGKSGNKEFFVYAEYSR